MTRKKRILTDHAESVEKNMIVHHLFYLYSVGWWA